MPTYNFTGRPIRFLTPDSDEIPADGFAEVVTVSEPERDVLVLNDGREVPGLVSRPGNETIRAPWLPGSDVNPIKLTEHDAIIINAQVAQAMEARNLRVDAQVWSPGRIKISSQDIYFAPKPIRHQSLTKIKGQRGG